MTTARTASTVVWLYNDEAWNNQRFDLAEELLGEQVVRHGVDEVITLTHDEAVQRIKDAYTVYATIHFTLLTVVADPDDEHVAIVYQCDMTGHDGSHDQIASIEVFRVVHGRIVEVYNNAHQHGSWR
ncbi:MULTISPECIES: nuclear transport factor 2 family protein [Mycobacterium]|uniref:SnoaL-like domain-containing protein n=1 Tax=Mycobacterium gordonae TaxID=1778 RepID=A0A1A6BII4_MYCGO|nr:MULTISPECIES: nuclear transport factor 2 family protein [Mycobacterium]MCQ4359967.1 nuclear transport factor 2 family protein [Mycobacterium gordonae]MCV7005200.1 nuclear transport factor 2 family protein [Mycobacterium gordonae]OBS02029.1 hypothetical protein A9W98_17065 [Mycobacterium gordonae]ODR21499.1 hypothetical protein BHQ23_12260 [Mycobacterium gordonae]ORV94351.1 hypothetical protein AWC08_16860 [Mycobacterium gordonae]